MNNKLISGLCLSVLCTFSGSALAKTLVYCSEASPEGFNPRLIRSPPQNHMQSTPDNKAGQSSQSTI